jgi:hypothetical protein
MTSSSTISRGAGDATTLRQPRLARRPRRLHARVALVHRRRGLEWGARRDAQAYECKPGAALTPLPRGYQRRQPEKSVLHEVVRENLESFLAQMREEGRALPRFVENELRGYLSCGLLGEGFVRCVCQFRGDELLVAFSCKGRGFCPSCCARRMSDTAAHLVKDVET